MANIFPKSANWLPIKIAVIVLVFIAPAVTAGVWYYFTPKYSRVGYQPVQPVSFPHNIHVDQLGMDCRYCHSFVEVAAHSNIPATQVCMNCHSLVQKDNPKLKALIDSWTTGKPVEWVQVHKTPDFAYFNHSAHVNRGVSCVSCHGRVDQMETVFHHESQSMAWCLDCHRAPEEHLRPLNQITNLGWKPEQLDAKAFIDKYGLPPAVPVTNTDEHGGVTKSDVEKAAKVRAMVLADPGVKLAQEDVGVVLKVHEMVNPPDKNCFGCHR